jgi:adenylate kinase
MVIIVTGTPGTGKTTFARKLAAERGYAYIDLNNFALAEDCVVEHDEQRDALVIDEEKLVERVVNSFERGTKVVLDGHFSHEIPPAIVEKCYVTKTPLPELRKRLEARAYTQQKVQENLECEIFDLCHEEAKENGHDVEIVWT